MPVRVRFAPSPTGFMHVGNARTAIFNYLFAKHHKGKFILRIEDTDIQRHSEEAVRAIYNSLKWMNLHWDEGPDVGGPFGPYRQSERLAIYKNFIEKLRTEGHIYECFCSQEELDRMRQEQLKRGEPPRYDGRCRHLSENEKKKLRSQGRKPVLRFKVPDNTAINWKDLVKGEISINSSQLGGDFVIVRSNGTPVYNFVVVIDDALMEITHVIRGEDHISNTPKQILIYNALAFKVPQFAHLPMILGEDKSKLSKRHGATSVEEFKEKGYLPEAFVNFLSLLGWYPKDGKEILSMEELIARFDIKDVSKSPAIFNTEKLDWMNQVYIRKYPIPKLTELIIPYLKKAGIDTDRYEKSWLENIVELTREYLTTLNDAPEHMKIFLTDRILLDDRAKEFLNRNHIKVIEVFSKKVSDAQSFDSQSIKKLLKETGKETGQKGKNLFMPIRIAITGKTDGVEIDKLMECLGKERILNRINKIIPDIKETVGEKAQ